MKITVIELQKGNNTAHVKLIEDILQTEFPELHKIYDEIGIIIGNDEDIRSGRFEKAVAKFLRNVQTIVSLTEASFSVRNTSYPPKACLEINLSKFGMFEGWKQKLAVRHECCHLMLKKEISTTLIALKENYSMDYLKNFVKYRSEYCAHLCIIKRYPEDWLKEPVGWSEKTESPSAFYNTKKRSEGQKAAIYWSIANIVHILSVLYLYEHIPENLQYKITRKKEIAEKFLNEFFIEVQKYMRVNLLTPRNWLTPQDFLSEETYFQKIQALLMLVENYYKG